MGEPIRLGAFVLESPLSAGGMGTIWRARHELTDTPVAVKVIAGAYSQDPIYLDGFEREVQAVARMEHPRIVRVYDYGVVDSAAVRTSGGELPRRSPWLAMELATRGSLAQQPGVAEFGTVAAVLFDILDALAHSHARGVVHRDLKPGNILLTDSEDGVVCKLTDFGISHVSGGSQSTREVFATSAGTPWYMAPEQVDSRWRDYGPWTDLYALGCVAYQLASGETPFVGESAVRVARQQLFDRPPPLQPRIDAPAGFGAWVERLLVKEIPHRFRRAADAAWALHQLFPRTAGPIRLSLRSGVDDEISAIDTTAMLHYDSSIATLTFLDTPAPVREVMPKFSVPGSLLTFSVPPLASTWKAESELDEWLPGSGLGLYRLRETPLLGRLRERDVIWDQLREAVTKRQTRVVVIRGGPGSGKSRLALWTAQRAHELGATSTMYGRHSPIGGEAHGIGAMCQQYLHCGGLDFERTYLRIRRLISTESTAAPDAISYFSAGLARFIHPGGEAPGVPAVRFTSADERYQVLRRLLTDLAERRGLFCVLDDVQWGYDALELTRRLLEDERPILIVLAVRPDQLVGRPLEAEILRDIEAHDAVTSLELGPLTRSEQSHLIDTLLALEPTLRDEVLDRAQGSPLFATELLGDWVRRRVLRASPQGFRIDATEELPTDIHGLWNRRVDRVLAHTSSPELARGAIEIGAALGNLVAEHEWRDACEELGVEIDDGLVEQLVANGLIERTDTGWAFQHQMLRESIAEGARTAGRASKQHRVVAEMLRFDESADSQLRRALHYLAVGDWIAAAEPLSLAVEEMITVGRTREASAVLVTLEEVFEHIPDAHDLRRRVYSARLLVLRQTGDPDAIRSYIAEVRPIARERGWQSILADLARIEGAFVIERGEFAAGRELLNVALSHARLSRHPATLAAVHAALGWVCVRLGELDKALAHFETTRDHFQMAGQPERVSDALVGLAEVSIVRDDLAGARRYNDEAIRLSREGGYRVLLATHINHRGDIAAAEGDYRTAHRSYLEATELSRLTDNRHFYPIALVNLGMASMYLERPDAADLLREALRALEDDGLVLYTFYAELGLLWACAPRDPSAWDEQYAELLARAVEDVALRENADHAIAAGSRWKAAGDDARAAQAFQLARTLVPEGYVESYAQMIAEAESK